MKNDMPMYLLTVALLAVAVYLKSPVTAIVTVGLWAVRAAESVLSRKNRDADIEAMMAVQQAQEKKMNSLSKDVSNVAERARVILGEHY